MILHKDAFIELRYDVAHDILTIAWPDIVEFSASVLPASFAKLSEIIRHYDIKKLLIDSRLNLVELEEEAYTTLICALGQSLSKSRLEQVARVGSLDSAREQKALRHTDSLLKEHNPPFAFRNFSTIADAHTWLTR